MKNIEENSPLMNCETDSTCSSDSPKYKRIKSDKKTQLLEKIFFENQRIKKVINEITHRKKLKKKKKNI